MRVLLLTQFYPPVIGGEERHVRNLALALVRRGHDVSVVTQWNPKSQSREVDNGVKIHRLRGTMRRASWLFSETDRPHAPPFPDPELVLGIARIFKSEPPDIVHAHNWMVHSYTPLRCLFDAPLIVTLHDYSLICPKKTLLRNGRLCEGPTTLKCLPCAAQLYGVTKGAVTTLGCVAMAYLERRNVDMFVSVSRAVAELNRLEESTVTSQVISNFIPEDFESSNTDLYPIAKDLPPEYILFVGDLRECKGIQVLYDAYRRLRHAPQLVLIGRPTPETPKEQPRGVQIFNNWPHAAVMHAWRNCLFGVAPSTWAEPSATVIMEAMAMGKPMIVTEMGGSPDIVADGRTGLVVPPNDPIALADAMQRLLDDAELRTGMSEACHGWVKKFRARAVVDQIEAAYQALLDKRLKRPSNELSQASR
jgi:glycosyltransferase involved in cell wall biosynthesis